MAETLLQSGGQLYAVSGRRPRIDLAEAVRASVPNIYARKAFEQDQVRLRLEEEAQQRAGTQQTIGNVLSGTGTLIQGGQLAKSAGLLGGGTSGTVSTPAVAASPTIGTEAGVVTGAELASTGAEVAATTGGAATTAPGTTGAATTGTASTLGAVGVGATGGVIGGQVGTQVGKRVPGPGAVKGLTGATVGGAAGAGSAIAIGAALGTAVGPVGTIVGAAIGGLVAGLQSSGICILVTCCHGRDSEEVALARRYRERYLDAVDLRGYYAVSEPMVYEMQDNPRYTQEVRTELVEPLLKWGAFVLGESVEPPSEAEARKAGAFLRYIRAVGETMDSFTRSNGETI